MIMKKKNLLKLIVGVSLAAVMAISIPLMSGCAAPGPAPTPTPEPGVTPTPEPTPEPAAEEPTYDLRFTTYWGYAQVDELMRPWADELEKASGNRLNVEVFAFGELMPVEQELHALQTGTVDLAILAGGWYGVPIDVILFDGAPTFGWNSQMEGITLWEYEGCKEIFREAYEELDNIKWLGIHPSDPEYLITNRPIEKYEDLQGLRISAALTQCYPFIEAGAIAVNVTVDEWYLAGETGIMDAIMTGGALQAYSNSWHEPYPYFLSNCILGAWMANVICNRNVWDSFSPDLQALITQSIESLSYRALTYFYDGELECRQHFTVTTMPDEDWAKIRSIAHRRWEEEAQKSPRVAKLVQILKDYDAKVEARKWFR